MLPCRPQNRVEPESRELLCEQHLKKLCKLFTFEFAENTKLEKAEGMFFETVEKRNTWRKV